MHIHAANSNWFMWLHALGGQRVKIIKYIACRTLVFSENNDGPLQTFPSRRETCSDKYLRQMILFYNVEDKQKGLTLRKDHLGGD